MIRPKPDIPERIPVLSFPTPEGQADLLFYEIRDGDLPKNKSWSYGDPHPDTAKFPHHELVFVTAEGGAGWQRWYYSANRENQHRYNWQLTDTPDWPQLTQTFIVRRSDFSVTSTYDMPPVEVLAYPLEWTVTGVEERPINDEVLASTFVMVAVTREKLRVRQVIASLSIGTIANVTALSTLGTLLAINDYIECPATYLPPGVRVSNFSPPATAYTAVAAFATGTFDAVAVRYVDSEIIGKEFDPEINATTSFRRAKVPANTTIPSGIQSDGSIVELQPINTLWSIKNTKKAAGLAGSAINGKATRTFQIVTNWAWPAVLDYVNITPVYADNSDIYSAVTGYVTSPRFVADAYSGPCLATIIEEWTSALPVVGGDPTWNSTKATSPLLPEPTPLLPKAISFNSPLLDVSVQECLHDYITFYAANFQQEFPATNYTRWPGSIVAEVDLRAHQGGWLKRVMLVNCPSQAGVAPELYLTVGTTFATSFQLNWGNLAYTTALKLDVSSDPTFKTGFLPGFKDFSVLGLATKTVTGASRGVPYYSRLTVTRTTGATTVVRESNIAVVMCPPQAEIALSTPGPDGLVNTIDDVPLPAVTGVIDFGQAQTTEDTFKTIIIRNDGLLSLSGIAVVFEGGYRSYFSVVGTLPTSVAPGGYATVLVKMRPTAAVGAISVSMTITSNAVNIPSYLVTLTGTAVQPEIDVLYAGVSRPSGGSTVALGNVNTGSVGTFSFSILNTGNGALTAVVGISDSSSPPPWDLLSSPEAPIAAGATGTFSVSFTPTEAGAKTLSVSINNNDPTGAEDPYLLTLSATGVAVGLIDVTAPSGADLSPGASYYFGFSAATVLKQATFGVVNRGAGTLSSLAATLSGTDAAQFSVGSFVTSVVSGGTANLTIGFTPTTSGLKSAVLTVASSDPNQPTYVINLTGTGGTEHEIQVESPLGSILTDNTGVSTYGSMLTGTSRTKRFWVRNVGNADLTGLAATLTGTDAAKFFVTNVVLADSTTVVTRLEPGQSAFVDVTLTPGTTVGPLEAKLNIASNDHDENPFEVPLLGFSYNSGSLPTSSSASLILGQTSSSADTTWVGAPSAAQLSTSLGSRPAVSSSGRVAIADTVANRVLIWNSYPALATGQAADLVLGQPNLTSYSDSVAITQSNLRLPKAVAWYGEKLLVSDTVRNRILIWNNPATNNQAADMVLGQVNFTSGLPGASPTKFKGITDIFVVPSGSQAGKLIATDPGNYRVLIWNSFPAASNAAANLALGQTSLSVALLPTGPSYTPAGSLSLPRFRAPSAACVSPVDGKLYIADAYFNRVLGYGSVPTSGVPPDIILFQTDLSTSFTGATRDWCNGPSGLSMNAVGQLAVSDTNNRRVLIFYTAPANGSQPHAVLGQPNFTTNSVLTRSETTLNSAAGLTWQGGDLLVADRNRVAIFKP
jgi:hypothetical protein